MIKLLDEIERLDGLYKHTFINYEKYKESYEKFLNSYKPFLVKEGD